MYLLVRNSVGYRLLVYPYTKNVNTLKSKFSSFRFSTLSLRQNTSNLYEKYYNHGSYDIIRNKKKIAFNLKYISIINRNNIYLFFFFI